MKEFWGLVRRFDIKALMMTPTDNVILQLFRYLFVGGFAFLMDNGSYALLLWVGMTRHYVAALVISFLLGLVTNYVLSKWLVFRKEDARVNGMLEFLSYAAIGVIGLGITAVLVWFGSWGLANLSGDTTLSLRAWSWTENADVRGWQAFSAKIVAAVIVLFWNFMARKVFLYKGRTGK